MNYLIEENREHEAMNALINIELGVDALKNNDVLQHLTGEEMNHLASKMEELIDILKNNHEYQEQRSLDEYFRESQDAFSSMLEAARRR